MKPVLNVISFLLVFSYAYCQEGFGYNSKKAKVSVSFQLINNLIIIPIEVNGVKLDFLLDTGVEQTILFSLENKEEVQLYNVESIKLKGLGSQEAIEGLKSTGNTMTFKSIVAEKQDIYVVLDSGFDLSSTLGFPVNGIIGYSFFKNNLVEINYSDKKITLHDRQKFNPKKLEKYQCLDITIEKGKPYIESLVTIGEEQIKSKLLIDIGNGDAVWIFQNKNQFIIPKNNIEDFLGRGFNGEVHGKRSRISHFILGNHQIDNPIAAFPDTLSSKNVSFVENRVGSIGGEVCKRFNIFFDYHNQKILIKKNNSYNEPFNYNMSGIVLHHAGDRIVPELVKEKERPLDGIKIELGDQKVNLKYKFELKPVYEIMNIRKDSPAEKSGLKVGDIIVRINNVSSYRFTLQEINNLLKSEDGRKMEIEVERDNKSMTFDFRLKNLL
jgi:hypothetical protein